MNKLLNDLQQASQSLLGTTGLLQLAVLAGSVGLAWMIGRNIRRRITARTPGRASSWAVASGGAHRLVTPLLALTFTWLATTVIATAQPTPLLKLALPLLASFVAIRFLVYLVHTLFEDSPLLKTYERFLAYSIWVLVALYLTGSLVEVEKALNEFTFTVGKQKITLLMLLSGLVTVVFTVMVALALSRVVEARLMAAESLSLGSRLVVAKLVHALSLFVAILVALPLVGIDLTVLSVFGGAIGVGLGFGLQKVASNYVSGFIILLERSIRVGDVVTVDNKHGSISSINGRYTVIKSLDGTESLLPNELLITQTVVNHTFSDQVVLVQVPVTVAYASDLAKADAILLAAAKNQPRVLPEPTPTVIIKNLGDNGIELVLFIWIKDADQGLAILRSDIYREVWKNFQQTGIEVPFPQRQLNVAPGVLGLATPPASPAPPQSAAGQVAR